MTFGEYLVGVVGLAAVAAPIGFAAVHLRRQWLPGWEGAPARLAEAVVGLSILTVLLQLLGTVGLFNPIAIVLASLAIGASVMFWSHRTLGAPSSRIPRKRRPNDAGTPPAPPIPTAQLLIALLAAVFLATHWATGLQDVWGRGMHTFDTLWYHGPFAARLAETGSIWGLHFTDPLYLNWFYPQNSELLHGVGIALFDRDLLSPLVNFGFLGVALLAAWCIGRPYGVAPLSLVAVTLILDTGPLVPREAGTPANDMAPIALLLAAAAILINAWAARQPTPAEEGAGMGSPGKSGRRQARASAGGSGAREGPPGGFAGLPGGPISAALLIAGLALGLALGTKLTVAGGVAAFAAGVPLLVPAGVRLRAVGFLLGGIALTAGFWFIRNLIRSGNPLPWIQEVGPIDLPGPGRGLEGRDDYTVSHYIFENPDSGVWSQFRGAITNLLGPIWPLLLAAPAAGAVLAIWRPRSPAVRLCGIVTIVSAVAYLFTPLTAAGPEGDPQAFGINLRYVVPALALGLALLPLERKLTPERFRLPLLIGGLAALVITSQYSDSATIWDEPFASIPEFAVLIGLVLVAALVGIALLARRAVLPAMIVSGVLALAIGAAGWERQDDYLDARYSRSEDFRFELDRLAAWAKPTSDLRIGVVGTSGAYNQYLLYGDELSNRLDYLGEQRSGGNFVAIEKCADLRQAINDGNYDFVITTPELDLNNPEDVGSSPERGWLIDAPQLGEQLRTAKISVFEVSGDLDPGTCGGEEVSDGGDYALGMAGLAAIVASLAYAAHTLRRWLLPGWSGAPALLACGVLGIGMLVIFSELLGLFGLLDGPLLVAACLVAALAALRVSGTLPDDEAGEEEGMRPAKTVFPLEVALAISGIALLVAVQWAGPTLQALDRGIYGGDSLWYHLPFSAHMAQTGSVTELLFTDPLYLNWFYPQVSELIHADGLLLLGNDFLSPLLNMLWLGLALLAAWCIGRPYGASAAAVAAIAALAAADLLFSRQPGNANNDIVAIALLLSSVALLVNSRAWEGVGMGSAGKSGRRRPQTPTEGQSKDSAPESARRACVLLAAGLAAGLAVGTKLTVVPPVAALTVGVVAISASGTRLRAATAWIGALLAGGGLWYIRDAIVAKTPFPFVDIGPLDKPEELEGRDPYSIAHYATDSDVWGKFFRPGLEERLGDLWFLFLAAAVIGVVLWLWRGGRLERMLAAVALFAAIAYLLTPLGASGPEGAPVGFRLNIRYLAPGLALALVLAAIAPSLAGKRALGFRYLAFALFAGLAIVSAEAFDQIDGERERGSLLLAAAVIALPPALVLLARRGVPRVAVALIAVAALAGLAVAGRSVQDEYLDLRYSDAAPDYPTTEQPSIELGQGLGSAYQWARETTNSEIGLVGTTGALFQYGLWGPDSSNAVTYLGDRGDRGAFHEIDECPEFVAAVNEGNYDYVITTPNYDQDNPTSAEVPIQRSWLASAPNATRVAGEDLVNVWGLNGPVEPETCEQLPETEG